MKKIFTMIGAGVLLHTTVFAQQPERCGMKAWHDKMIAQDPSWAEKFQAQKEALQADAESYLLYKAQAGTERTTVTSAIPVIFHIIVDSAQFNNLGGTSGIIKRCDSQIAVLNRDFNKQNSDSSLIPASWKSLYGNSGISFGLARKDPSGNCSPGYEIRIIAGSTLTDAGYDVINETTPKEKLASTGLASWDHTKYFNVWCINFTGAAASLLGITVPPAGGPSSQHGVCILYNSLGKTTSGAGSFPSPYNKGRTLTHEVGHFFEIWHPWGDDGGRCPTWSSTASGCSSGTGSDDGISDTPPESDAVYGSPTYTISGGTIHDCCEFHGTTETQPIGVACLSYMDYTDDGAMHMFTTLQAAAMASKVLVSGGESYSLTQNPSLLVPCTTTGVEPSVTELKSSLSVYPNPTTGEINISVNSQEEILDNIVVVNLVGQQVALVQGQNKDYYSIDLSGLSKGIYFVKCNFASGSVTRKILLQ